MIDVIPDGRDDESVLGSISLEDFAVSNNDSEMAHVGLRFFHDRKSSAIQMSIESAFVQDRSADAIKEDRVEVVTQEMPLSSDYIVSREAEFIQRLVEEHPQLRNIAIEIAE